MKREVRYRNLLGIRQLELGVDLVRASQDRGGMKSRRKRMVMGKRRT